jgi:putative lipoprotein
MQIQVLKRDFRLIGLAGLTLLLLSGCTTPPVNSDAWLGKDKLYHFVATTAIGAGACLAAQDNGASTAKAPIIGISVAIGVGAAKEGYDQWVRHTYWSWKDLVWDVIGGVCGSFAAQGVK